MEATGATLSEMACKAGEMAGQQAWRSTRHRAAREKQNLEKMGMKEPRMLHFALF